MYFLCSAFEVFFFLLPLISLSLYICIYTCKIQFPAVVTYQVAFLAHFCFADSFVKGGVDFGSGFTGDNSVFFR